jgi:hypothetical protein
MLLVGTSARVQRAHMAMTLAHMAMNRLYEAVWLLAASAVARTWHAWAGMVVYASV